MKKFIVIILSITLIISVALNVRFYVMLVENKDTWFITVSQSAIIEDKALYNLENNKVKKAKEILSKSVGEKALLIGTCIETKCISNEAITSITNKSLHGNDDKIWKLLTSNELWGGSGSIADQALIENDALRNQFQNIMIELGNLQLSENKVNERTETWVSAFSQWKN